MPGKWILQLRTHGDEVQPKGGAGSEWLEDSGRHHHYWDDHSGELYLVSVDGPAVMRTSYLPVFFLAFVCIHSSIGSLERYFALYSYKVNGVSDYISNTCLNGIPQLFAKAMNVENMISIHFARSPKSCTL